MLSKVTAGFVALSRCSGVLTPSAAMIYASLRRAVGFDIEDFSPRITAGCSCFTLPGTSRQYLPTHFLPTSFTEPDCPLRFDMQRPFRCCRFEATASHGTTALLTCSDTTCCCPVRDLKSRSGSTLGVFSQTDRFSVSTKHFSSFWSRKTKLKRPYF